MYNDMQTAAVISAGMKLLRDNLGVIETEIFITTISANNFDYTKWREHLWEDLTPQELFESVGELEQSYIVPERVKVRL